MYSESRILTICSVIAFQFNQSHTYEQQQNNNLILKYKFSGLRDMCNNTYKYNIMNLWLFHYVTKVTQNGGLKSSDSSIP